jgi:hypothetical protein
MKVCRPEAAIRISRLAPRPEVSMTKLPVRSVTLVVSVVLSAEIRTKGPAGRLTVTD